MASNLFVLAAPLQAQTVNKYTVEITGAGPTSGLLEQHLEIRQHQQNANFTEQELRRLVDITPEQIRELVATEGYFSPTIEPQLDLTGSQPLARFHIQLGEPTTVGTVDIHFKGDIARETEASRVERLRDAWSLGSGSLFKQSAWNEAKNALLKNLLLRDYPAANIVASEARVYPEQRVANLSVEVDSGPAFTFGQLEVTGLQRYPRSLVDRLNPIRPGDRFSQDKLNDLQSRLQGSGYFLSAFATIDADPEHPDQVPIHVDLNESPLKKLSLGLGFSTDAGPRVEAHWLHRNFLERDWRLESDVQWDGKTRRAGLGLTLPPLRNGWIPGYEARFQRQDIAGELTDNGRVGARLSSADKRDEKVWAIAYYADRQYLSSSTNDRQALMASFTYIKRRLDNIITPRRGYVASLGLGAGVAGLGEQSYFQRVLATANYLSPLRGRWQLIARGQVGQVFGSSRFDVPGDLLFRTGGDQTVRGYALDSLGVVQDGAIVGGRVQAVASGELVYQLTPQWGAAVFIDAGNAADTWKGFKFERGTGVGARWRSPIGSVNLDLAYGEASQSLRLHFTVGYGF